MGSKGLDVGKSFANGIIRFINNNVIKKINDLLDFTISLPFGASFRVNPPDIKGIPELAEGGIVTSPTLAMIGEGRGPEAVIPLSKMGQFGMGGGGGITITCRLALTEKNWSEHWNVKHGAVAQWSAPSQGTRPEYDD